MIKVFWIIGSASLSKPAISNLNLSVPEKSISSNKDLSSIKEISPVTHMSYILSYKFISKTRTKISIDSTSKPPSLSEDKRHLVKIY